jgi:16S rRNA (cytidine1402-2'-O)-methyltransferase
MALILAATPLGNFADASNNLKSALQSAEIILAEDSRRLTRLVKDLGISYQAKVISFFEGNEVDRIDQVVQLLKAEKEVLAVTDAGMPSISDPGFRLVRAAIENNIPIKVLPGPSAVTMALTLSGLPSARFIFEGFIGKTQQARKNYFESIKNEERTLIYFESPKRVVNFLSDAIEVLGESRLIAICREMTKAHEEVFRGSLGEALLWANSKEMLGEFTIVLSGQVSSERWDEAKILTEVNNLAKIGLRSKEAAAQITKASGWSKREIFDLLVAHKD